MDAEQRDQQVNRATFFAAAAGIVLLALIPLALYLGLLVRLFRWITHSKESRWKQ